VEQTGLKSDMIATSLTSQTATLGSKTFVFGGFLGTPLNIGWLPGTRLRFTSGTGSVCILEGTVTSIPYHHQPK